MIRTNEVIIDPVAFLQANAELVEGVALGDTTFLLGPDMDVFICGGGVQVDDQRLEPWVETKSTNAFLGDLYVEGFARDVAVGSNSSYSLEWFPSPTHVNELSEDLGLKPGEDVLKFTHAFHIGPYGQVPYEKYIEHFSRGEYPQSLSEIIMFKHDRHNDHAPGAILLPPGVLEGIKNQSQEASSVGASRYSSHARMGFATKLDEVTSATTEYSTYLVDEVGGLLPADEVAIKLKNIVRHNKKLFNERTALIQFDAVAGANHPGAEFSISRRSREIQRVGLYVYDYLASLKPAIDRVRQERAIDTNMQDTA